MGWLRSLFLFFIYSNFYIASIAVLLVFQTGWLFNTTVPSELLLFTGFATLTSYNFHYFFTDHSVLPSPRVKWTLRYRSWIITLFVMAATGATFYGWKLIAHWAWLIPAIIATFLYSAPKIPLSPFRALRKVAIGKTIFLAFIWMYVTAVLPLVISGTEWNSFNKLYCFQQFFLIYTICILFDIRDREDDRADGVRSLIIFLAPGQVRRLYFLSLGMALACIGLLLVKGLLLPQAIPLVIPVLILFFIYEKAVNDLSDRFYYFFLDGLMALSAILMAVTRI